MDEKITCRTGEPHPHTLHCHLSHRGGHSAVHFLWHLRLCARLALEILAGSTRGQGGRRGSSFLAAGGRLCRQTGLDNSIDTRAAFQELGVRLKYLIPTFTLTTSYMCLNVNNLFSLRYCVCSVLQILKFAGWQVWKRAV